MFKHLRSFRIINSEGGFVLVAAIIACAVLMALAMLVISSSTGDLRITTSVVGDKMALSAVESGAHNLTQTFESDASKTNYGLPTAWQSVSTNSTAQYKYTVFSGSALSPIPLTGYSMDGGQAWGLTRTNITIDGQDTAYNSAMSVDVCVGFGPVPITTVYR